MEGNVQLIESSGLEKSKPEDNVSYKHIIRITYPVILSMFSMNIMVFIDRAFVAKYSLTQFAATLPASNLALTFSSVFIGIVGYSSMLISQYFGAKKYKECSATMWQGVYLSLISSVILLIISLMAANIFKLMGHSGDLLNFERQFFYLIIIANCFQLFTTAFSSIYRGIGDTKTTMFVAIAANIVNVIFDWIFIFGKLGSPEMGGILGSGTATILSCIISLVVYMVLLKIRAPKIGDEIFKERKFDKSLMFKFIQFGFPAGIQSFVGTGYYSLLLLIIGKTGEFNLSCSNIAFTIEGISIFPVWGLGTAISIIAGQERGAGRLENIARVLKRGVFLGLCFNLLIIIVFNFFPDALISIFNSGEDKEKFASITKATIPLVRLTAVWLVFDTIQIIIGNVLRSVGDTVFMMVIYLVMPFIFYIVLPFYLSVVLGLPLFWIWVELLIFTLGMLTLVATRFYGGKWKKIEVI